jgi:carbonic anhydrase
VLNMSKVILRLIDGVRSFSRTECAKYSSYNKTVENGQSPKVMIISCSDSLVDPAVLMNARPGELFIHRNIAGLVPPYKAEEMLTPHGTSAVIEHGIKNLNVEHVVILGHGYCGGIAALLDDSTDQESSQSFIHSWMKIAIPVKEKMKKEKPDISHLEQRNFCEKESVSLSLKNIMTFPWVSQRVGEGSLSLHGWHFDRGILSIYDDQKECFETKIL